MSSGSPTEHRCSFDLNVVPRQLEVIVLMKGFEQSNFQDIHRICNAQEIDSTDGLRNNKRKQKTRKLKISCKHRKPSQTMRKHETKHV